jgi:hypothetical protein
MKSREEVTMKIKWCLDLGLAGEKHEGELELTDDATDAEIEDEVKEDVWKILSLSWERVKP